MGSLFGHCLQWGGWGLLTPGLQNDVSLPSHRWTNGWQPLKNIVTNGWLTEKTIEKPLVPMVEQVPFHQWQWSP